jgi:undecaprenyl-diphosphatase
MKRTLFENQQICDRPAAAPASDERQPPVYLRRLFGRLDPFELRLVRRFARHRSHTAALRTAVLINKLGDGWIYPVLALVIFIAAGRIAIKPAVAAVLAAAVAHSIYPLIKRYLARQRPFERDPSLIAGVAPLDKFSCPSGHAMTATAVFIPLLSISLPLAVGLLVVWCLLVWARLILGHHYASDVIAGIAIGAASAALSSALLIPRFSSLLGYM